MSTYDYLCRTCESTFTLRVPQEERRSLHACTVCGDAERRIPLVRAAAIRTRTSAQGPPLDFKRRDERSDRGRDERGGVAFSAESCGAVIVNGCKVHGVKTGVAVKDCGLLTVDHFTAENTETAMVLENTTAKIGKLTVR